MCVSRKTTQSYGTYSSLAYMGRAVCSGGTSLQLSHACAGIQYSKFKIRDVGMRQYSYLSI